MPTISTTPADAALLAVREPPNSVDCEQSVIGGLLMNNAAYDRVADFLHQDDFYRADHRLLYRHIATMIEQNRPVDALTLAESLGDDLQSVGGQAYIGSLVLNTPSAANIRRYAEIVREKSLLRCVIGIGASLADKGFSAGVDADALVDEAEGRLFNLREQHTRGDIVPMRVAMVEAIEHVDRMYGSGGKLSGISCGLANLDHMTGGFEGGDLIIVGARPSMGKTSLALGMAQDVCAATGKPVAFFSMEMSRKQLAMRMLASSSGISMHALRTGTVAEDDWCGIVDHTAKLSDLPLHIDDTPAITVGFMRSRLRRLVREHGPLAMIVVDYLTLMSGEGVTPNERVDGISKGLKSIAKELATPVVTLAQLNRGVELRPNKRPTMADLRDSGAIEQAADIILFIYRDDVYDPDSPRKGIAEIIIGKQRNGPTGTVYADFNAHRMRFVDRAAPVPMDEPIDSRTQRRGANMYDYAKKASGDF